MFRIDNCTTIPDFQYNLTHFNESSYYYDIGASSITFSRKKIISCQNLAYIFVKPFLFTFSKFLNLFSYLRFLYQRPAHFTQVTSRIYTGSPPSKRMRVIKNCLDLDHFLMNNNLSGLIRSIQILTKLGDVYLYSRYEKERTFISNLIHHYYGNKPSDDPRITGLGLKIDALQRHTQDIYSGPIPLFRSDYELLKAENIKTIVYLGNDETPEDVQGLGLAHIPHLFKLTPEGLQQCADLIVSRSRFGAKLYFCSTAPVVIPLLVPYIYQGIAAFRNPDREQNYLSVPLD